VDLGDLSNAGANADASALVLAVQDGALVGVSRPIVTVSRTEPIDPARLRYTLAPVK
jgi:hypothetical protein